MIIERKFAAGGESYYILNPPRILYHGCLDDEICRYYRLSSKERKNHPIFLSDNVETAIKTAVYKMRPRVRKPVNEGISNILIIDTQKIRGKLEFDNGWLTRDLPIDCFSFIGNTCSLRFLNYPGFYSLKEQIKDSTNKITRKSKQELEEINTREYCY